MRQLLFILAFVFTSLFSFSQNTGVGVGTVTPIPSAAFEIKDTARGFLPPRMSFAQRNAIINPVQGLIIYCTDCGMNGGEPQFFNGNVWLNMIGGQAQIGPANLPYVTIGSQKWATRNLDVSTYRNGDIIPQVTDANQWANLTTGAWCWYNNDSVNYGATYGKLYNWQAVNDPRGLAPQGWRIPTERDWNKLAKTLDNNADTICKNCIQSNILGGYLKESGTAHWLSPNTGSTNSSGFSALPGGFRAYNGPFNYVGAFGYWWSAEESNGWGWLRHTYYSIPNWGRYEYDKKNGMSVRVMRD
jgi:uncharacterized protein (TIGR02145 family)